MEKLFWAAIPTYYISLAAAITANPNYFLITALLFLIIPSLTKTETVPGTEQVLKTQVELLKTQREIL